ncbi:MAG: DUF47 domain-containing protein [Armatimonadetes bacterium]|nr:DUF47 domain-containing protein [Armatimonadota bacterium]
MRILFGRPRRGAAFASIATTFRLPDFRLTDPFSWGLVPVAPGKRSAPHDAVDRTEEAMRLLPRKDEFFSLLDRQADNIKQMADEFSELLRNLDDLPAKQALLEELEHTGDDLTHQLAHVMHSTFVTPLDKEDIAALYSGLDDVADCIDAAAKRLVLYRIQESTVEAMELGGLLKRTVHEVAGLVKQLRSLRNRELLFELFGKIHTLENDADDVYRSALGNLFNAPNADPIQILKWKEIYERIEMAVDACEDVANVIESIVLKYA